MSKNIIISKNSNLSKYFNYKKFDAKFVSSKEFLEEDLDNTDCVINLGRPSDLNKFEEIIKKVSKANVKYIHSSSIGIFDKKNWAVKKGVKFKEDEENLIKKKIDIKNFKVLRIGHIVGNNFIMSSIIIRMLFEDKCFIPNNNSNVIFTCELFFLIDKICKDWNLYSNYLTCVSSTNITWYDLYNKYLMCILGGQIDSNEKRLFKIENIKDKKDIFKIFNAIKINVKLDLNQLRYNDLAIYLDNLLNKFYKLNKKKISNIGGKKENFTNHFLFNEKRLSTSLDFTLNQLDYEKDIKQSIKSYFGDY